MVISMLLALSLANFTLKASTPRGDYYVPREHPKLSVNTRQCDTFLADAERKMGVTVPRFTYIRVKTQADVQAYGGTFANGLAFTDIRMILSIKSCSKHEMAHLVIAQLGMGRADRVFEEGVADMLAGTHGLLDRWENRRLMRHFRYRYSLAENRIYADGVSFQEQGRIYRLSDSWVRHLVKKHGISALRCYFQTQADGTPSKEAFRVAYGTDLHATFDSWLYGRKGPST